MFFFSPKINRNHTTEGQDTDLQRCTIFVHEKNAAHAASTNIRAARKMAAQSILDEIERDPGFLENICTCKAFPKDPSLLNDDEDDEELID